MFGGQSMFSLFGWWVAWVYALSLTLPTVLPKGSGPDDPRFREWAAEVRFASNGFSLVESDVNGLLRLKAVLGSPAPIAMEVPVEVRPATAKEGSDYRVATTGATVLFEKGAVEGTFRLVQERGPDVAPIDDDVWRGARSLRLRLLGNQKVVAAGDAGLCTVTIQDDDPAPKDLTPIRFSQAEVATTERELAGLEIRADAEAAVAQKTPVQFQLYRTGTAGRRQVATFQKQLAPGDRSIALRLADVLGEEQRREAGIADDGLPGPDEAYELEMLAPPPLYPAEPGACRILAANDDAPPKIRPVYFDANGQEISYIDPEGGMTVELVGEPLETASSYDLSINDRDVPGGVVVPAGRRRGNVVSLGRCGLGDCRGRRCDVGAKCRGGGCPGQEGVNQRSLVGAPVPGDALVVLVNNGRLHERGDEVVAQVKVALSGKPSDLYGDAVVILNRQDEDRMTAGSGEPDPAKAYRPFEQAGDDVAGQLKRIEEFVARKRESAQREDLRAIVIWPERDLAAGAGLSPAGGGSSPISFLLPDAEPAVAHDLRKGLVPRDTVPGRVTVRSPPARELETHLRNVLEHAEGEAEGTDAALQRAL
jgi:hypothetical protein